MASSQSARVGDSAEFLRLARAFAQAGRGDLVIELRKGLQKAVKDEITPASRAQALALLPSSGGLAERVSKAPQRTVARVRPDSASVRVTAGKRGSGARGADDGVVRHPVYGNRRNWSAQLVRPRWFTGTAISKKPEVRQELVDVLDDFAARLVAGI